MLMGGQHKNDRTTPCTRALKQRAQNGDEDGDGKDIFERGRVPIENRIHFVRLLLMKTYTIRRTQRKNEENAPTTNQAMEGTARGTVEKTKARQRALRVSWWKGHHRIV